MYFWPSESGNAHLNQAFPGGQSGLSIGAITPRCGSNWAQPSVTELERIFLTSGLTIVGGLIALVLGQLVLRWIIDPLHEFRMLVGEIAFAIVFYINATHDPGFVSAATPQQAREAYRSLSGKLHQRMYAIPLYGLLSLLRVVPPRNDVMKAASQLTGLSNSFGASSEGRSDRAAAIAMALRIRGSG
jgi:hypothetical protein